MTSTEYGLKLKDPRWQRRRLEIFNLHDFKCQDCGSRETTLHAHHCYYIGERNPWDYRDDCFRCLCERCHATRHDIEGSLVLQFRKIIARRDQRTLEQLFYIFDDCVVEKAPLMISKYEPPISWPAWALETSTPNQHK